MQIRVFPAQKISGHTRHKTNADHTERFHCASVVDVFCAYVYVCVFSSLSCVCASCVFSSSGDHVIFVGYTEIHIL